VERISWSCSPWAGEEESGGNPNDGGRQAATARVPHRWSSSGDGNGCSLASRSPWRQPRAPAANRSGQSGGQARRRRSASVVASQAALDFRGRFRGERRAPDVGCGQRGRAGTASGAGYRHQRKRAQRASEQGGATV
jgi:hypothetical protein